MSDQAADTRVCPACRFARLSRYNLEPLCGSCLVAARGSAGVTPIWIWDSAPLRAALARADMAAVLAVLRGASGLSQLDFGSLLGWSQSAVTKIERRQRRTFHDIAEILKVCDLLGMPREALLPLVLGAPDAMLDCEEVLFWGVGVDRRQFNRIVSGMAVAAWLPALERVDKGHVRYLESCLQHLRTRDRTVGGGLLGQAVQIYRRAQAMLNESDYTEHVGRALLTVTAELANMAGWLAYDANNQPLARSLYTEAELLAASAGDATLQVHIYANMAQQSTHLARITEQRGTAREALRFADRAQDAARHTPFAKLQALIALRQALAYVQLDDKAAFNASIGRARDELDRADGREELPWTTFVSPSELTGYEAMGAARLGAPGKAADLYLTVLADSDRSPRDLAVYRACLAATLVDIGDQDAAVAEGMTVLPELGNPLGSARVLRELEPVRESAAVSEPAFCHRFDTAARMVTTAAT